MLIPPPLTPGDAIRVIAPSGVFDRERFEAGVALLRARGFLVRVSDRIFESHRYLAGSVEARAAELNAAFAEPDTRAVWAARGGYGAGQLLPEMAAPGSGPPKWLVGFSDLTALHMRLQDRGIASLHGPNMTTLPEWTKAHREELFGLLAVGGSQRFTGHSMGAPGASVKGPLLGGNLTVLTSLVGTGALPSFAGAVVFLEDVGERPYRLDRNLNQLRLSGIFDAVAGFVLGQWKGCDSPDGSCTGLEVVGEGLNGFGVPILAGLEVGHEAGSRPLVLGAEATLDPEAGELTLGSCSPGEE